MSRAVAEARRTLNRFTFNKTHAWDSVKQVRVWSDPVYVLRPRDFNTRLAEIRPMSFPHSKEDAELFFDAVQTLVNATAPPLRKRKRRK